MNHLSRIAVFLEVAKHNSFSGAARSLGLTGPAVSKQVQALESALDVRLLNRTTRHVSLTEEGGVYAERARKALEDLEEAEQLIQELKALPTGKLKVNAPMSFGHHYLCEPIAAFAKLYPQVNMEIDLSDRWVDVLEEGYDLIVRIGVLKDSSLIARKLANCPILLCATPDFIKQHGPIETPQDLGDAPSIVYSRHGRVDDWQYKTSQGAVASIRLQQAMAVNTAEMQLEACLQSLGLAVLPMFSAAPYLESGELIRVLPELNTYPERGIYAIYPQSRQLSRRVRLFIDHLVEATKHLDW